MEEMNSAIVKKIQKLLALADTARNNSEEEAKSALLKAQELMAQYGVEVSLLDGPDEKISYSLEECVHKGNKGFRCQLSMIIARNFRCKAILLNNSQVAFFGWAQDAKVAKSAFEYAYAVAKKLGDKQVAIARKHNEETKNVFNSYVAGFLSGLRSKLDAQCTALVLVVSEDVKTEFNKKFPSLKSHKGGLTANQPFQRDVYERGVTDGRTCLDKRSLEA
jgi:hypothetical protein